MTSLVDKALGIHQYALSARVERSKVLASNLANVDTPGYLARDYDFKTALQQVAHALETRGGRDPMPRLDQVLDAKYRVPMQPSEDGNTSELGVEQAKFAANAMDFQTSLTFLNMKISGLRDAIKGQ
jgi:flagellar basal-body rod protein FlgB